jgi:predicted transcriptional regulator
MGKTVTLRLEDDMYNTLKRAADGDRRTISNFIVYATINYIFEPVPKLINCALTAHGFGTGSFNNNVVDNNEMNEVAIFERDVEEGMEDIRRGRYKIIG